MNNQASLNLLFRLGLRKDFRDEWKEYPPQYSQFLKVGTTNMPEVSASIFTAFARMLEIDDGEDPAFEKLVQGPKVAAVDKEYAIGTQITRKAREDDLYGKTRQTTKYLAHAGRMTFEYRGAAFLDDAFTGTNFKGIDGKALLANDHTFLNAPGTWSNTAAAPVGLSIAGLTALYDLALTLRDHNGDPTPANPNHLIHGNNAVDALTATKIFQGDKEPFTANNDDNAIRKRLGISKITQSVYKTSAKPYMIVDSALNDAHFLVKRALNYRDWEDPKSKAFMAAGDCRFIIWFVDPRGWWGSNAS